MQEIDWWEELKVFICFLNAAWYIVFVMWIYKEKKEKNQGSMKREKR